MDLHHNHVWVIDFLTQLQPFPIISIAITMSGHNHFRLGVLTHNNVKLWIGPLTMQGYGFAPVTPISNHNPNHNRVRIQ